MRGQRHCRAVGEDECRPKVDAWTRIASAHDRGSIAAAREQFERELVSALPGTEIVSANAPRLWNTTAALMPEADCQQRWVVKLDEFLCSLPVWFRGYHPRHVWQKLRPMAVAYVLTKS